MAVAGVGRAVDISTDGSAVSGTTDDTKIQKLATSAIESLKNINAPNQELERQLNQLNANEFLSFLEAWSDKVTTADNPLELCHSLAALLSVDQVERAVGDILFPESDRDVHSHIMELVKSIQGTAEFFISHTETFRGGINFEHMLEKVWVICSNIIVALGIKDLLELHEGQLDAAYKVQRLIIASQAYTLLLQLAIAVGGYKIGLTVTCCLIALIMVLSVSPRLISVPPHKLLNEVENLTLQAQRGELKRYEGRRQEKKAIAKALATGKHVLLTGKAGVGKTEIIKGGFVFDLLEGVFPELPKNLRLFYGNGADIRGATSWTSDNQPLQRIKNNMEGEEDRVVVVIDEIHSLYEPQFGTVSSLGESLLTKLDAGGFGLVIGITTDEGYRTMEMTGGKTDSTKSLPEEIPVLRRFKRIPIKSATPEEMVVILENVLLRQKPFTICEPGALAYLAQETKKKYGTGSKEPSQSMAVLKTVFQRLSCTTSDIADELEEKRQQLLVLDVGSLNDSARDPQQELSNKDTDLRATKLRLRDECDDLEVQLKKQQKKANLLSKRAEQYYMVQKRFSEAVLKICNAENEKENARKDLKIFLLIHYFVISKLFKKIKEEATSEGLEFVLTKEIIDDVLFDLKVPAPQKPRYAKLDDFGKNALS